MDDPQPKRLLRMTTVIVGHGTAPVVEMNSEEDRDYTL